MLLAASSWLGAPCVPNVAAESGPLPPAVADLNHELQSSDHAIVYRLTPEPVIERVMINGRKPGGQRGAVPPGLAPGPVSEPGAGTPARAIDHATAPSAPEGRSAVGVSGSHRDAPVPPVPRAAPASSAGPARRAVASPAPTGTPADERGVPASEEVTRTILERVEALVEQTRRATLGGRPRPAP